MGKIKIKGGIVSGCGFAFHFADFKIGKSGYTITFIGHSTVFGSRKVEFRFSGVDMDVDGSLPGEIKEKLRDELVKDYGYGKYSMEKVKKQFIKKSSYFINYDRNEEGEEDWE